MMLPLGLQQEAVQRQYDEVIAPHYDLDSKGVLGQSMERAIEQICRCRLSDNGRPFKVLDLGMGTGKFLEMLQGHQGGLQAFGIDLSARMIDIARGRIPGLVAAVDDVAHLDAHFGVESFDLICTHFITGFVPMSLLAPTIHRRLTEGGSWSLVGGTKAGFPTLRKKAGEPPLKWLFGGRPLGVDELVCNPADREEVVRVLESHGFAVRECETFTPRLAFKNLKEFMDFAYFGGWLTPFVEALGLHQARAVTRALLDTFFFPVEDHHCIEIVLAQKKKG